MAASRSREFALTESRRRALVCAVGCVVGLAIYWPALDGPFISDDIFYVSANSFVQTLDLDNAVAILDPSGEPAVRTLNYAPAHLFAHALEWHWFGGATRGYHVVNLMLHLGVSALVVLLLRRGGVAPALAALGGAFFLVQPANVQAVAWIFQLKTVLSTGLGIAALLTFVRWPALSLGLFIFALLTKISAAFALAALAVSLHCARDRGAVNRRARLWLAAWTLAFLLVAIPIWRAIDHTGIGDASPYEGFSTAALTMVGFAMRYIVMAASAYGVSAFQEPARIVSPGDPWFLGGVLVLTLLAYRLVRTLLRRQPEAVFWTLALAAWVPVSQIIPFRFAMGDHYLYPILPGLIGGTLLALQPHLGRALSGRGTADDAAASRVRITALAAISLVLLGFAAHAHTRASLWVSARAVSEDAALHYPEGLEAHRLRLFDAAERSDVAAAAAALEGLRQLGTNDFGEILSNPAFASVRDDAAFHAVIVRMAEYWIERAQQQEEQPTQLELRSFANAHYLVGDLTTSIALLDRALATPGPAHDAVARDLDARRLELRLRERLPARRRAEGRP